MFRPPFACSNRLKTALLRTLNANLECPVVLTCSSKNQPEHRTDSSSPAGVIKAHHDPPVAPVAGPRQSEPWGPSACSLMRAALDDFAGTHHLPPTILSPSCRVRFVNADGSADCALTLDQWREEVLSQLRESFPDLAFIGESIETGEAARVTAKLAVRGTHTGCPYSPSVGASQGSSPVPTTTLPFLIRDAAAEFTVKRGKIVGITVAGAGPADIHAQAMKTYLLNLDLCHELQKQKLSCHNDSQRDGASLLNSSEQSHGGSQGTGDTTDQLAKSLRNLPVEDYDLIQYGKSEEDSEGPRTVICPKGTAQGWNEGFKTPLHCPFMRLDHQSTKVVCQKDGGPCELQATEAAS